MKAQTHSSSGKGGTTKAAAGMPVPDLRKMRARAGEAAKLLKALSNEQRLRILCLLASGERTVGEINEQLPELSQSALSQHLARLRSEKLVSTARQSQTIRYSIKPGPAQRIMGALYEIYCTSRNA